MSELFHLICYYSYNDAMMRILLNDYFRNYRVPEHYLMETLNSEWLLTVFVVVVVVFCF